MGPSILTPDQRVRVFVSSTLGELATERAAVRRGVERLHLLPVMFELGARPHPPRELYRAYLAQSHVFLGIYWQRYGWVAPGKDVSGLEDEYRLCGNLPRLVYVKDPAPKREPRLQALLARIQEDDRGSSASAPPPSRATPASPSLTPSITPNAAAGAPSVEVSSAGSSAVGTSWPRSARRLADPMPATPGVHQPTRPPAASAAS